MPLWPQVIYAYQAAPSSDSPEWSSLALRHQDGQSKDDRRYFEGTLALLSSEGRLFSHRLRRFLDDKWPTLRAFNSSAAAASSEAKSKPATADDDDDDDGIGTPGANQLLVRPAAGGIGQLLNQPECRA